MSRPYPTWNRASMMRYGFLIYLFLLITTGALANTEIANFEALESRNFDIWFVREWPTLSANQSVIHWNLTANPLGTPSTEVNKEPCVRLYHWNPTTTPEKCIQELWLALDLDGESWTKYTKFTLRISWPASFPVDTHLKIFDSSDIAPLPRPGPPRRFRNRQRTSKFTVRRKFARIQLVNTGVVNPTSDLAKSLLLVEQGRVVAGDLTTLPGPVPIIVRLEPLVFGVIPESVVPTLYVLVGAVVVGVVVARAVVKRLKGEVEEYQKGLKPEEEQEEEKKKKEE